MILQFLHHVVLFSITRAWELCNHDNERVLAAQHGFEVEELRTYYKSSYFSFFFTLYLVWRSLIILFEQVNSEQAAETFCMKLRRI